MQYISIFKIATLLFFIGFLSSCGVDTNSSFKMKPTAMGKTNQLVIIADQEDWEGPIGDTIRFYYSTSYPILPQPEPIFDLRHYTPEKLEKEYMRKELRTYMIVGDVLDKESSTAKFISKDLGNEKINRGVDDAKYSTIIGKDKWAHGQLLFYLFGEGEKNVTDNLKKHFPSISKRIIRHDKEQIEANVYLGQENKVIQNTIKEKYGFDIVIPSNYVVALDNDTVMWLRQDDKVSVNNIVIQKVPYTNKDQLTKEGIKALRDDFGKRHVSTSVENSYMRINDKDLPMYTEPKEIGGKYALEAKGIWEIANDFMGGAFVSYLILDETKNELIFLDGFIHAPGKKKRDYIQRLEFIFTTTTF